MLFLIITGSCVAAPEITPLSPEQLAHTTARIAAVQMSGNWVWQGDDDMPQATTNAVVAYIDRAGADKADIVAFPELLLGKFRVPCEATDRIGEAAARNKVNVVVGCFEIIGDDGSYANSTLVFDRDGSVVGRYLKTHAACGEGPQLWPGRAEDAEWLMELGQGFPAFDLDIGRVGIFTCYDGYFPEPGRILSLKGAEILVWANAREGSVEEYLALSELHRNYVHLVCTNKAAGAGTMIAEWPRDIRARIEDAREDYIVADVDLARLRIARKNAREFYQRRPEIYGEILGEHPVWKAYANMQTPPRFEEQLELRPVDVEEPVLPRPDMVPGTDLSQLAIEMRAPWMEGWIRLRLPETLQSDRGFHFIDHYLPEPQQLNPLAPWPRWERDDRTRAWRYQAKTQEGLHFAASARPYRDMVYLELTFRNDTDRTLEFVEANPCLMLDYAPQFRGRHDLGSLYVVMDGRLQPLSNTTPSPAQKGRDPWVIMRTRERAHEWKGGDDSPTWWLLDQTADTNLMMAPTHDGRHLVAYAWDYEPIVLMSNCGHPCFHTGPAAVLNLAAGESATRRGVVYLMANDPDALLERFRHDQSAWRRWPKRPAS